MGGNRKSDPKRVEFDCLIIWIFVVVVVAVVVVFIPFPWVGSIQLPRFQTPFNRGLPMMARHGTLAMCGNSGVGSERNPNHQHGDYQNCPFKRT